VAYSPPVIVLLLIAVILVGSLAIGWRMFAAETSPRAANALLLMLAGIGLAAWLLSAASFDAGF
jgi:hypothetical protein